MARDAASGCPAGGGQPVADGRLCGGRAVRRAARPGLAGRIEPGRLDLRPADLEPFGAGRRGFAPDRRRTGPPQPCRARGAPDSPHGGLGGPAGRPRRHRHLPAGRPAAARDRPGRSRHRAGRAFPRGALAGLRARRHGLAAAHGRFDARAPRRGHGDHRPCRRGQRGGQLGLHLWPWRPSGTGADRFGMVERGHQQRDAARLRPRPAVRPADAPLSAAGPLVAPGMGALCRCLADRPADLCHHRGRGRPVQRRRAADRADRRDPAGRAHRRHAAGRNHLPGAIRPWAGRHDPRRAGLWRATMQRLRARAGRRWR